LYEMVCGRPPFTGDTELATALAHVRTDPVPPRRLRAGIPRPLEQAILHAMARNPADRPQTVGAFRAELGAVDLGPDDATSFLTPDPTPSEGLVVPEPVRPRPSGHRAAIVLPLIALIAILVLATVLAIRRAGGGGSATGATGTAKGAPIHIGTASAFDPLGA